jgi:hypothetical protein
VTRGT